MTDDTLEYYQEEDNEMATKLEKMIHARSLTPEEEPQTPPEVNLLWALYDRMLRDLEYRAIDGKKYMRESVRWFKSKAKGPFSFAYVKEYCNPSPYLLKRTFEKVMQAETMLYRNGITA